jgi:predicted aspartyl protease
VTVVPFQLYHGLILIPGEIDGRHGTFLLDTGAQLISVNSAYVKPKITNGVLDTVVAGDTSQSDARVLFNAHVLHIGTLTHQLDTTDAGQFKVNAANMSDNRFKNFGGLPPILGLWGLPALRSFETIIDYPHQRLILIALDKAGHRRAEVPAYRPTTTIRLVKDSDIGCYRVIARLGGKLDTLVVDTGNPDNTITPDTREELAHHVSPGTGTGYSGGDLMTLDTMRLAGQSYHPVPVAVLNAGGYGMDILGYPFLNQFGVVGFNFRTRQLLIYH